MSADQFLHPEILWKRDIILSHKHSYFGISSFSSAVPRVCQREGRDVRGDQQAKAHNHIWGRQDAAVTPQGIFEKRRVSSHWIHKCHGGCLHWYCDKEKMLGNSSLFPFLFPWQVSKSLGPSYSVAERTHELSPTGRPYFGKNPALRYSPRPSIAASKYPNAKFISCSTFSHFIPP